MINCEKNEKPEKGGEPLTEDGRRPEASGRRLLYLVLILPFLGTLFPAIYNRPTPALFGMPFFYWYQLLWVVVSGLLTLLVLALTD
jgi:hypothetical protein